MGRLKLFVWLLVPVVFAGCNTLGPEYKGGALDGIVAGQPRMSQAATPPAKTVTVGLIASDATELTLKYLAETQKQLSGKYSDHVRAAAGSYDPRRPVSQVVEMLRSSFAEVRLIPDMNALGSLPQPALGCVFDLRTAGINDLGGQRINATSELWFLDNQGTVRFAALGRAYKSNPGGTQTSTAAWTTVQSSAIQAAIDDMREKLVQKLRAADETSR